MMEFLVPDHSEDTGPEHARQIRDELSRLVRDLDTEASVFETALERGAGFPYLLVSLTSLLLLGDRVDKALDGWIGVGRKFKALLAWIKEKFKAVMLDADGAILLALCDAIEQLQPGCGSVILRTHSFVPVGGGQVFGRGQLDKAPVGIHLIVIEVSSMLVIYGITTSANVLFRQTMPADRYHY